METEHQPIKGHVNQENGVKNENITIHIEEKWNKNENKKQGK